MKTANMRKKHYLQLSETFRAFSRNENAVLLMPPTWKIRVKSKSRWSNCPKNDCRLLKRNWKVLRNVWVYLIYLLYEIQWVRDFGHSEMSYQNTCSDIVLKHMCCYIYSHFKTIDLNLYLEISRYSLFTVELLLLTSYLYEETKNSKTIFMFDCLHNIVIFGVITYKVQL